MEHSGTRGGGARPKSAGADAGHALISAEHYLRILLHRWWVVLGVFAAVSAGTAIVAYQLPDIYTSETVILVDPQKVPDTYVKPTVTGDIRNRLGTLSQQILSATRLQKIIDTLNLYPQERKTMAREDVITKMRGDISVNVISDFGASQDLQAFRIRYSGRDPRLVAQVANELASLFIEENLKAREQQATGTTEFLQNQLQETRKALEQQEAKLRDFKLKHIGEMPEQQAADLQILGQLQSQLQIESDALSRAEQQKSYIQSMIASQSAPVVDLDESEQKPAGETKPEAPKQTTLSALKARLASLEGRYSDIHPEIRRLKRQIADEEARERSEKPQAAAAASPPAETPARKPARSIPAPVRSANPVLQSQLTTIEREIAKHKEEQQRLSKLIATYHAKLEAIPVREQQISDLVRDYEISKAHYKDLLGKQLSAETATQLEIRQKGEKFSVLDPAQPAEKPSRPNRALINAAGSLAGLALGVCAALMTEFLGISITAPDQLAAVGIPVLEVIPIIRTRRDRIARRRRIVLAAICSTAATAIAGVAFMFYRYHTQGFW